MGQSLANNKPKPGKYWAYTWQIIDLNLANNGPEHRKNGPKPGKSGPKPGK